MRLILDVKRYHEFFWLRSIRNVNIYKCCAECFIGDRDGRVYWRTLHQPTVHIDIEVKEHPKAVAYYLCGLSAGFNWWQNTHVAFVPAAGEKILIDNANIRLEITDAREIRFQEYKPNPPGYFTKRQRTCRNWIFANYINDGMLLKEDSKDGNAGNN
ncbi:hypothetical protein [uncultured Bacteroides sp.]|uniref:hypothetical protein n=1 Tax=uncultured Bacteroides sp. TaxID=162156 RepID=UPI002593FCF8|nr:hypothetical protein [uncultured Bacteroides sp.]